MTLMRKGHTNPFPMPGDVWVSDDERTVYLVDQNGSNRKVKNLGLKTDILNRFHEIKEAETARQVAAAAPITTVDPKTLSEATAALSMGAPVCSI